jgi:uncharacterized membrane protein
MLRLMSRPAPLALALVVSTAIPVLVALVRVVQIPSGTYPEDSARLAVAPVAWFAHVLAATAFGLTGPLQFIRALRHRFGALHCLTGRIFVVSGAMLGLSGLVLLVQVASVRLPLAELARGVLGLALLIALALAMAAIRNGDVPCHRAWMIRAYAIGMGTGAVALTFIPISMITGQEPTGLVSDTLFIGSWLLTIAFAEVVIRHSRRSAPWVPA